MKKVKKVFGIAVVSIIIIIIAGRLAYVTAYEKIAKEYISVYTNDKEAFRCVANTIRKWTGDYEIYFDYPDGDMDFGDCVSSDNPLFESLMLHNNKFYKSIKSIYETNKIRRISVYNGDVRFVFCKQTRGQTDGLIYGYGIKRCSCRHRIEEHWALETCPDHHRHGYDIW